MTTTIDYTALTAPTTRAAVNAFRTEMKAAGVNWGGSSIFGVLPVVFVFVLVVIFGVGSAGRWITSSLASASDDLHLPSGLIAFLLSALLLGALGVWFWLRRNANWERWMRLSRFAAANNLVYSPSSPDPQYPGSIFGLGSGRSALNHLRAQGTRFLDIGSYQYTTGSGKSRQTHNWGFMAFHLDRKLPHMLLDARSNNGWFGTNLPSNFDKSQVLSLEGDFNDHFTLYCPSAYERDALYVFTPDLMALLIDEASPFDVEIVDDWMFVYSSRPFNPTDPEVYRRLFRIVDTVGAKTLSQSDRYVDERVGTFAANIVAPEGRRLKKGFPVIAVVIVVIFIAVWIVPQLTEIFN